MAENSKIEWTHHTFNPWRGCTKVSAGCANCYAETLSGRNPKTLGVWGRNGTRIVASESMWAQPLRWNVAAKQAGERHRVFCASLADVFEGRDTMPAESWEAVEATRLRLFKLIWQTPFLDWQLLTKRPKNIHSQLYDLSSAAWKRAKDSGEGFNCEFTPWLDRWYDGEPPNNVWLGASVEDQNQEQRIIDLLSVAARIHFLSCEPMLGPVDLVNIKDKFSQIDALNGITNNHSWHQSTGNSSIDWVICGGESGPDARPLNPEWAQSLRDQCRNANVPFFFKQWGEWVPSQQVEDDDVSVDIHVGKYPEHPWWHMITEREGVNFATSHKVGKKKAGRLLDGRTWDEMPEVSS